MIYRAYMGGSCLACGENMGFIEASGGRTREYCNDVCRQRAHRKRKHEEKRAAILAYNTELRDMWRENSIDGPLLLELQNMLVKHGKEATLNATKLVLLAIKWERRHPGSIMRR